ncbi:Oligopeptide-binding protein AppA precursor [compost metagenome]
MKMKGLLALILSASLTAPALAAAPNPNAPKGGNFVFNLGGEPPTVHPITSTDLYSRKVRNYVCEGLASRDPETYEWKSRLAEKWEISKDNKVFTFHLRKNAVFHDGKPVTAEDVKFSFDAIFEPKYEAAHLRPYFEGLVKAEVLDPHTIRFTARDLYFNNFESAATLDVIPKHVYSDVAKSKRMNRELVCTGPYSLEKFDRGQVIRLKKFDKWWGNTDAGWKGAYNFDSITMRFYKDENVELERAKKGELDFLEMRVEAFMKKSEGAPWGKTVLKNKVENSAPKPYGFIGWNFRKDLFQDRDVRVALAHLLNREEMNKKFRYGMSELATGAVYNRSEYAPPGVKAIEFSPKKAQELLAKAGWTDKDKNGVLEKAINGKVTEFKFTLVYPNKDVEKYYTMYRQDLKKAGIDMELKYLEWNSFLKLVDEGNFDAVTMAWGGGSVDPDPKQIWHSSGAVAGGSNFIAYKNPEVDKLIDEARVEPNKPKRVKLLQQVYKKIAEDAPYAFLFNDKYYFYANSNRMGKPTDTFKYDVGFDYWWMKKP